MKKFIGLSLSAVGLWLMASIPCPLVPAVQGKTLELTYSVFFPPPPMDSASRQWTGQRKLRKERTVR